MTTKKGRPTKDEAAYKTVMNMFHGECILCHSSWGVTVHEIIPRSLAPKTWMEVANRVPLCSVCHEKVHNMNKRDREALLYPARERMLKYWYALNPTDKM